MASKPLTIPNVFASEGTGTPNNIPLLDADFTQVANYFNDGSFFSTRGVDTGAANAYVVTLPSGYVPSAYNVGMRLVFNPGSSNTGASTINVNALGTQTILTANGAALNGGEITAGYDCDLVYDGTNFRVLSLAIPQITMVRLRTFSAVGNPSFEVTQRNTGAAQTAIGNSTAIEDRWRFFKAGTHVETAQVMTNQRVVLPGTNFLVSSAFLRLTLTTQESSLAAGDYCFIQETIEGPALRELLNDVHSLEVLVRSSVAGQVISLCLRDSAAAYTLVVSGTLTSANTWYLLQFPNLPVFTVSSSNWSILPGNAGYLLGICLGAGSTFTAPSAGVWNAGNFNAAPGTTNWMASPVNSTFDIAFCQHEPGPLCTTLQDKPFSVNYDECQRFYFKSFPYAQAIATAGFGSCNPSFLCTSATAANGFGVFAKPMAKSPSIVVYNASNGTANSAYDMWTGSSFSVTPAQVSEKSFMQLTGSGFTTGHTLGVNYTADTGW